MLPAPLRFRPVTSSLMRRRRRPSRSASWCRARHRRACSVFSVTPRFFAASPVEYPSTSRNTNAVRSNGESSSRFALMISRSSVPSNTCSGFGPLAAKRSVAGNSSSRGVSSSETAGRALALRRRITAALITMRVSQVENCERPSKRFRLRYAESRPSCKASSASSALPSTRRAVWNSGPWSRRNSASTACESPRWPARISFSSLNCSPTATCVAILVPPFTSKPFRRAMRVLISMHRHTAGLFARLLQQPKHRNDGEKHHAQHLEIVNKCEHGRLPLHRAVNHLLRLRRCVRQAGARGNQFRLCATQHVVVRRAVRVYVVGRPHLVRLRPSFQHGCDCGDTYAGADIPRQVDDAGAHVGHFPRYVCKRRDVDGNKQERQAKAWKHARASRVPVVELQIPASHHEKRGSHDDGTKRNQETCVHPGHQHAHNGHHAHNHGATRRQRQSCQFGRIAHHLLQELWDQHRAGIHHKSKEKHGYCGDREIAIPQHAQIDYRVFLP